METLLMVKPDIVERGLYGEIISIVLRSHFRITALRMLTFTRELAEQFYEVHKGKGFFEDLVRYVTSGPVVAMRVEGPDVIERVRALIGQTDPAKAQPGTIRSMYGSNIQNNAVHASDSPESAKKELAIAFGGS